MKDCIFCNRENIKDDIVHQTTNLFVKVGFGLVTPGHVMIIPNEHYNCFGDLPNGLEGEFDELKVNLQTQLTNTFAEPFEIEYGIWGQSVPHAHTHFIPLKGNGYEINSILEEMVIPERIRFEEVDRRGLKLIFQNEGEYVSIEEHGRLYACHIKGVTYNKDHPLSFRAFFTKKGLRGISDWRDMPDEDKKIDEGKRKLTKERLIGLL